MSIMQALNGFKRAYDNRSIPELLSVMEYLTTLCEVPDGREALGEIITLGIEREIVDLEACIFPHLAPLRTHPPYHPKALQSALKQALETALTQMQSES